MDDESDLSGSRNMNLTGASSVASVDDEQEEEHLQREEDAQDEADGAAALPPGRKLALAATAVRPNIATRYCFHPSIIGLRRIHMNYFA